jgi:hypothetical protein
LPSLGCYLSSCSSQAPDAARRLTELIGVIAASITLGRSPPEVDLPGEPAELRLAFTLSDALFGLLV